MSSFFSSLPRLYCGIAVVLVLSACGDKAKLESQLREATTELETKRPLVHTLESEVAIAHQEVDNLTGGRGEVDKYKELEDKVAALEADLDKASLEEQSTHAAVEELKKRLETYSTLVSAH